MLDDYRRTTTPMETRHHRFDPPTQRSATSDGGVSNPASTTTAPWGLGVAPRLVSWTERCTCEPLHRSPGRLAARTLD